MLPYHMFDVSRTAEEARRAEKLANIYHRSQSSAWEGRNVLAELMEKHGGIQIDPRHKGPIKRIFSVLMWGELAAWRISAQLADRLEPLEQKMAATSQVFDEARHFYVMHDYLAAMNNVPEAPDKHTQAALEMVLSTDNIMEKLVGMQMLFEPTALTIFKVVRDLNIEPVLSELLPYFERDEARHVGLGVQTLPDLINGTPARASARMMLFQVRLITQVLWSLKGLEADFQTLGMSAWDVLERGILKYQFSSNLVLEELSINLRPMQELAKRSIVAACELVFAREAAASPAMRLLRAANTLRRGAQLASEATA